MNNILKIGSSCCGCGACASACAPGAIEMRPDAESFFAPAVDPKKCVSCQKCLSVCPIENPREGARPIEAYAAASREDNVLSRSSSGGLFSAAASAILSEGGRVYGAALDESDWTVCIQSARDEKELSALCGSKYVQSLPVSVFREIKEALKNREKVLFTGCPCQVAALRVYLGDHADGLITIDIVCHGVPSPKLFQAYIAYLGEKEKTTIRNYRFRTKERGWGMTISYWASGKTVYKPTILDRYGYHFLSKNDYRLSCYECPFATDQRQGDLTIGDYWGILHEHPEFYSEKGVSLLLVNTDAGRALLKQIKGDINFVPTTFEKAARHNENLLRPSEKPAARDGFYEGINSLGMAAFAQSRLTVKPNPKQAIKALIPWQVKKLIQKMKGAGKRA